MVHQWIDTRVGDTFWVQQLTAAVPATGTNVSISDTAPTNHKINLTAVEITAGPPAPPDTTPPSAPGTLTAVGGGGTASLLWAPATDDVGVTGYSVYRSTTTGFTPAPANQIGTAVVAAYGDSALPAGVYYYRVVARDAAGNTGPPSNEAAATVTAVVDSRATTGEWAAPVDLPSIMQQGILIPGSSKVLFFKDGSSAATLDTATGAVTSVPSPSNLFCAGHAIMADGRPFIIGGDTNVSATGIVDTNVFDPATNTWSRVADMHFKRWYPTATRLSDGRLLALSGSNNGCLSCFVQTPEIYNPATNTWTSMPAADANIPYYPFVYLLPDGRLVQVGATESGTSTQVLDLQSQTWSMVDSRVFDAGSSTMYRPGKILKAGLSSDGNSAARPALATSYVIDMTSASPAWSQVGSMANPRAFLNLTTLPDGNVLATGGETTGDGVLLANAVKAAEMWSPTTNQWTTLASVQRPRLYHSIGMLLPDGRVLVGGSGNDGAVPNEPNYEIFSPPYLFKGPRPTIAAAPSGAAFGQSFAVTTPDASRIASVSLIAPAAVTHSFDENARFVPLSFTASAGALQIQAPADGNLAPPGQYMLFIVDSNGVPSVSKWIQVSAAPDTTPPGSPATLSATGGPGTASLSWGAATDNVGVTGYVVYRSSVTGFAPAPANQIATVSGTSYTDGPAAGTYYYRVAARDAAGNTGPPGNEAAAVVTTPPPPSGIALDRVVSVDASGASATTAAFSTAGPGELLVAFVSSDGPSTLGQSSTVSGAGLTWSLVRRSNAQPGTSEVWWALAPSSLNNVTVSALSSKTGFDQSLTVMALSGATGVGASAGVSTAGAPSVSLSTTAAGSWVVGTGNDWDRAEARTLGAGQSMVHQWIDTRVGDTFWVQQLTAAVPATGTNVSISDTAPTNHKINLTAVEIRAS